MGGQHISPCAQSGEVLDRTQKNKGLRVSGVFPNRTHPSITSCGSVMKLSGPDSEFHFPEIVQQNANDILGFMSVTPS